MGTFDLSPFCTTKSQATDFVTRISALSERVYQVKFDMERDLTDSIGMQKKDAFLLLLHHNNINTSSPTALKEFLKKIIEEIYDLPILTLSLAFEPNAKTLLALSEWCIVNLKKQLLFEITVDPSIVAGSILSFKGKYADYSSKTTVAAIIEASIKELSTTTAHTTPRLDHQQAEEHMVIGR